MYHLNSLATFDVFHYHQSFRSEHFGIHSWHIYFVAKFRSISEECCALLGIMSLMQEIRLELHLLRHIIGAAIR
jgi:hypothetical protein